MRFFVERKGTSNSLPFFLLFQRETFLAPAFAFGFRNEIAFVHIPGGSWHAIKTAPIMLKGRMFKFQFKQSAQRIIGMKPCSAMFWKTILKKQFSIVFKNKIMFKKLKYKKPYPCTYVQFKTTQNVFHIFSYLSKHFIKPLKNSNFTQFLKHGF